MFVNPRRFSHFASKSVEGCALLVGWGKNPESHRNSHRKDMSPLTQGLNYGSACDGRLCDFLGFFPEPTWRSHPSTDFDAKWLKRRGYMQGRASWGKNRYFFKPLTPRPPKPPKFAQFGRDLESFRSISRLTLEFSRVNTP